MSDYTTMELTDSTYTVSNQKYDDWLTNELMEFVWDTDDESSAVHNIGVIIKIYERRKSVWQVFKQFIKKLFL